MKQTPPSPTALRVSQLSQNQETTFVLRPETPRLKALSEDLGLLGLRKLSFEGHVVGEGKADWRLSAKLGATVTQACAVTLEPVTTRIDARVTRLFQKDYVDLDAPETEMPEDDTLEHLAAWIDPDAIMMEALVLHLPLYPRAPGAALGEFVTTEPGVQPMRDQDTRAFAGLAALQQQLKNDPTKAEISAPIVQQDEKDSTGNYRAGGKQVLKPRGLTARLPRFTGAAFHRSVGAGVRFSFACWRPARVWDKKPDHIEKGTCK